MPPRPRRFDFLANMAPKASNPLPTKSSILLINDGLTIGRRVPDLGFLCLGNLFFGILSLLLLYVRRAKNRITKQHLIKYIRYLNEISIE